MALEAFVYQEDPFTYYSYTYDECSYPYGFGLEPEHGMTGGKAPDGMTDYDVPLSLGKNVPRVESWDSSSNPMVECDAGFNSSPMFATTASVPSRRKRKRKPRVEKNKDVESQRIMHIAVERSRRKQMNEYLSMLRAMMPPSYTHRGDQASIIGGAVNFVKELEQLLHSLEATQREVPWTKNAIDIDLSTSPFTNFFTFPQYSTNPVHTNYYTGHPNIESLMAPERPKNAIANVEVTMTDTHVNVKVLSRKQPKQLLKMVAGLQYLCLTILHLNVVATVDDMVLYCFSLRVEDDCQLTSVNEIASAVHEMVGRIQEQAKFS